MSVDTQGQHPNLTPQEFFRSVTGEERGLVGRVFKKSLSKLSTEDPETWIEALVFLDLHRRREPDAQVRAHAMTIGELEDYFAGDSEDPSGEA